MQGSIYDFILNEEISFKTARVPIVDGYEWNMFDHIRKSTLYKNSQLETGNSDDKPVKNIIRPLINVAYRSEGFNVKDIDTYVDDEKNYYKSFLIRKFHSRWARKNDIDTFIDDMVESYVDYGGALIKNINSVRPEVTPLQSIAFCDQTDLLGGVIGIKHNFSVDQLLDMKWDKDKVNHAINCANSEKTLAQTQSEKGAKTPGKYIEVYELHGMMPTRWLTEKDRENTPEVPDNNYGIKETDEQHSYTRQAQYITYYVGEDGKNKGITLFRGKEKDSIFKAIIRDKIFGRALGFGGIEELFEAQVWTTYSMIQIKEMLDKASLMILQTADKAFAEQNKIDDLEKGEILVHKEGMPITQVSLQPQNLEQFEASINQWFEHAQITSAASDPALGVKPASGTPFRLQALVTQQGQSLHQFRQGKIATFMGEIYRDWILGWLSRDIVEGKKWRETLSLEELNEISDNIATNFVNAKILDVAMKTGRIATLAEQKAMTDKFKAEFMKGGTTKFFEIFKGEMKDVPIEVEVNIAGKQRDLEGITDKLTNVFKTIVQNPQILQNPAMAKLFNKIIESSGLDPIDFSGFTAPTAPATPQNPAEQQNSAPPPQQTPEIPITPTPPKSLLRIPRKALAK